MTDEAAESRGPATTGAGPSQDEPAPSTVAPEPPPAYQPPPPGAESPDDAPPPPPGATAPPPPGATPPPWFDSGSGPSFSREKLIRPNQGRYIAGVSGALGQATNTDPVLWRVLLAVLGFFGGVGVLIYLLGWLLIPAENDTASPIESLLGRGRSGMKPMSIVLLGGAAVLTFAFVVNDGLRAALLAAAVIAGAAVLLKRNNSATTPAGPEATPSAPFPPAQTASFSTVPAPAPAGPAPSATPAGEPVTAHLPPLPPQPPQFTPPAGGYRPPFAPHGPWAGNTQTPYAAAPPAPKPPKAPKPPREKSKLGRITFFALLLVMGFIALLDVVGVNVAVSAYFAAALTTIALGLILGAWFGRARGLIALALVATIGLAVSSGLERFPGQVGNNIYRPATVGGIADEYNFRFGNATVDLRNVDFAGAEQVTTVQMNVGQVKVLLPPTVDTVADIQMSDGRAVVFGRELSGTDISAQEYTDLGTDLAGGGKLRLTIKMNTGNVEVTR